MLVIRNQQTDVLSKYMIKRFEARIAVYLSKSFPDVDKDNLWQIIQYGIEKAKTYNIISESNVYEYIILMLILGQDFDTNPSYSWASEVLNSSIGSKMELLFEKAKELLQAGDRIQHNLLSLQELSF